MTKIEIRTIAGNVDLMDKLNTVSGLLEINKADDQGFIDLLVNDIYVELKNLLPVTEKYSKKGELENIKRVDIQKLKKQE